MLSDPSIISTGSRILLALRTDFNETAAKEITTAGPGIEKALQAFEQLIVQQLAVGRLAEYALLHKFYRHANQGY